MHLVFFVRQNLNRIQKRPLRKKDKTVCAKAAVYLFSTVYSTLVLIVLMHIKTQKYIELYIIYNITLVYTVHK